MVCPFRDTEARVFKSQKSLRERGATVNNYRGFYEAGATVKETAQRFGVSTGKMHKLLVKAGTEMRAVGTPKGYKYTGEALEAIKRGAKKRIIKPEQIERMRELGRSNACDYNGLNGYGHTKPHNAGYVRAYAPHHPKAAKDGYVMLHKVVMEMALGRYLAESEEVHHINRIKNDNRIENLQLMEKNDHRSMHMKERHKKRRDASLISVL